MRRQFTIWALAAILLSVAGLCAVQAEPLTQERVVQITSPERNAEVRGLVPIMGSASVPAFQFYKIEYGIGPNPSQWAIVGTMHDQPVINRQLEVWDTTLIPDGVYSLKLQAVKQDGNYEEFLVPQVVVVNSRPTATPTLAEATATPTPLATVTPMATAAPQATATIQIIVPEGDLAQPTVTPTLSRPTQRESLPIDPKSWGQAFVYGAAAMAIVLVLLGIVFGLRKLL
jgi:hypothetical protein